jgi:AcrR family transcriptional regulator
MGRTKTVSDDDLLKVAREAFVEKGFAASTREIARRAGVSEGVLFQRFANKEDLFFAAMIPPAADVHQLFDHPQAQGCELLEKITFAMLDYCRATLPVLLPLMLHPSFSFEVFAERHPDAPMLELRRQITLFMVQQKNAGRIGDVDPGAAALVVWSTANSIAFFERLGAHHGRFGDEMVRKTVRCFWNGLAPAPATQPPNPSRKTRRKRS